MCKQNDSYTSQSINVITLFYIVNRVGSARWSKNCRRQRDGSKVSGVELTGSESGLFCCEVESSRSGFKSSTLSRSRVKLCRPK